MTSITTTIPSATVSDLPAGALYFRVKARNDVGVSGNSSELILTRPDLQDYIEAIFLGSGPYATRSGQPSCPRPRNVVGNPGIWAGFPRGSTVRVLLSSAITGTNRTGIQTTVDSLSETTTGAIVATLQLVAETNPEPGPDEMGIALAPALIRECSVRGCCSQTSIGCILWSFRAPGVLEWSKGLFAEDAPPNPANFMHELGHGILGMCHIEAEPIGGGQNSLMSEGQGIVSNTGLSSFDKEAARTVYGSGLNPGASRDQFRSAGLIR